MEESKVGVQGPSALQARPGPNGVGPGERGAARKYYRDVGEKEGCSSPWPGTRTSIYTPYQCQRRNRHGIGN